MNAYRQMMRRRLLEQMYDRLSPEEKQTFLHLSMQDTPADRILQALQSQRLEIGEIHRKVARQSWLSDFSSNIAGNAVWDGLTWLGRTLLRRL
jgi:hypothetical protein